MKKYKIILINSEYYNIQNEFVLVDTQAEIKVMQPYQIVAEKLIDGSYDIFNIHTLNDIAKEYQHVIIAATFQIYNFPLISKEDILNLSNRKNFNEAFCEFEIKDLESFNARGHNFNKLKAERLLHDIIFPKPKITNNTIKILKLQHD